MLDLEDPGMRLMRLGTRALFGEKITGPTGARDERERAEGYRYLSRMLRAGLESFLESGDSAFPELRCPVHETIKMGADNPDNYYQNAMISGAHEYRLIGTRGTVNYLGFGTYAGGYGSEGRSAEILGTMEKELRDIRSTAYRTVQEVQGVADAAATRIYGAAYNQNPEFYSFLQTLESYKDGANPESVLLLTTDSDFYRYIKHAEPTN